MKSGQVNLRSKMLRTALVKRADMQPSLDEKHISSPNSLMKGRSKGTPGIDHKSRGGGFSGTVFTILI
jgi:hypothetical protein